MHNVMSLDSDRTPIRKRNAVSSFWKEALEKEKRGKQKHKLWYLSGGKWELYNSTFQSAWNQNSITVHTIHLSLILKVLVVKHILSTILRHIFFRYAVLKNSQNSQYNTRNKSRERQVQEFSKEIMTHYTNILALQ